MSKRLLDDNDDGLFSPLIDVVMGALGAFFILLVVYMMLFQQNSSPEPLRFLSKLGLSPLSQELSFAAPSTLPYQLPVAIQGQNYTFTFPVTGGTGKRGFELTGVLPSGLEFASDSGTIYGIPEIERGNGVQDFTFQVQVMDEVGGDGIEAALKVNSVAIPYDPEKNGVEIIQKKADLDDGRVGSLYEEVIGAMGGIKPYIWGVSDGDLPLGLKLEDGYIIGTPQEAGSFEFTARVWHTPGRWEYNNMTYDWVGGVSTKTYQIDIFDSLQYTVELPIGRVQEPFVGGIVVNGSISDEHIVWSEIIPGIEVSDNGKMLTGIPTNSGTYDISYKIYQDSTLLDQGSAGITILPQRPEPSVGSTVFQAWIGESTQLVIPYRGMIEPVRDITISDGELPTGLRLTDSSIVGTPTQSGLTTVTISIEDSAGGTHEGEITIRVGERF